MQFQLLIERLKQRLQKKLPGSESHNKFAPKGRINVELNKNNYKAKQSSVLILFYPNTHNINIPVIQRVKDNSVHSGQISLPGGHYENDDRNVTETALREAHEEIGVVKKDVEVLGQLTPIYIPVSNFAVYPIIGKLDYKPEFIPNKTEVDKIYEIPIKKLIDPDITEEEIIFKKIKIEAPFFNFKDVKIWGATAMILSEFSDILNEINNQYNK